MAKEAEEFPVILSGNCNTALGVLSGLNDGSGVVWFDCHGDFNTPETTIGGYLDGRALSMVAGHCWKQLTASIDGFKPVAEENIILIGGRDFDPLEIQNLSVSGITLIPVVMIHEKKFESENLFKPMQSIYLHIDLDVIDPEYVRVNSYSAPGGLFPEDLYAMITRIKSQYQISGLAFTAYDPAFDNDKKVPEIVKNILRIIL
jgi:arginase